MNPGLIAHLSACLLTVLAGASLAGPAPTAVKAYGDHHLHLRSENAANTLKAIRDALETEDSNEPVEALAAEAAIEALDRAGIQHGLLLSNAYMFAMPDIRPRDELADVQAENDFIAKQIARYRDRLVGLCSVNPLSAYALAETRRCKETLGLAGLKLHLANSDVDLLNAAHVERLKALFQYLNDIAYPVLAHIRTRNATYGARDAAVFIDEV